MKLLTRVWPGSRRFLRNGGRFTLVLCGFVLALEVAGRFARHDFQDLLGLLALNVALITVVIRHRRTPLPWLEGLLELCGQWGYQASQWQYKLGLDLRGEPPLPQAVPRWITWGIAGLVLWGMLAGLLWYLAPEAGWRLLGVYGSYTLYLAALGILWLLLLLLTFFGVYVPVTVLDRLLKTRLGDPDRRGVELAAVVAYAVLISALAWEAPCGWILLINGGLLLFTAAVGLLLGRDEAAVVWQSRRGIRALPIRRLLTLVAFLLLLLTADILVTACGNRLWGPPPGQDPLPLTGLLGAVAAWLLPGLWAVTLAFWCQSRRHDPARRTPPTVHIGGTDPLAIARAATLIRRWGWYVRRHPAPRQSGDVPILIVPPEQSQATDFDPPWPLRVSVEDLQRPEVRERLERRDVIQLRRQLFRGLHKLFKRLAPYRGPGGGAFWLAPHWWFLDSAGREESDPNSEEGRASLVGPPYHTVLSRRARQHAHALLRATHIDIIFVEDGVSFKHVERVLRILAELYDVHGGRRRAEDLHFRGLPKVRVMIHDYAPGNPFTHELYPEPKYLDLSRLRALHIFKDRGGEEEPITPPHEFSYTPAPSLSV
ncbi:MAG: hypothetical protein N3E46_11890 [Gemmataceae bacterium]|jgi:hypothetical protein|uniref:Uncharacterized protein n=1 Tax=Thermogemmata fonticola TaxID=2755323 RepID=A0A7V9ACP2_9BACT|nr:hypothetical protein [Thermogemmata fonticola]MBA2227168.1 hypothetical protein [Thermogemmata fonticola]MCX8140372.1 hypothetical protein [Gemmataceae bacterium]